MATIQKVLFCILKKIPKTAGPFILKDQTNLKG